MADVHPAFSHPSMQVANTFAAAVKTRKASTHTAATHDAVLQTMATSVPRAAPVVRTETIIHDPLSPITRR